MPENVSSVGVSVITKASARSRVLGVRSRLVSDVAAGVCLVLALLTPSWGAPVSGASTDSADSYAWMSLEDLGKIPVITVSKRAEPAWNVAAALSLVTAEDIRFSGARTLGDALRQAHGLSVAKVNARDWMVAARGFDQQFANKLLVMIDGRSIYTPLFGGVAWDEHDIDLADLEQIEVVRGPGAAVWGANAVNGVINIVSKPAGATMGSLISATAGTTELSASVRHGARLRDGWAYRVYARAARHESSRTESGSDSEDTWGSQRAGFRADRSRPGSARLTLQGEAYVSRGDFVREGPQFAPPRYSYVDRESGVRMSGGHVLGRWDNLGDDGLGAQVQIYADTSWRLQSAFELEQRAVDLQFQHVGEAGRHLWSGGAGFRASGDQVDGRNGLSYEPVKESTQLASLFVQDQISLASDRIQLVAGARIEDSDFVEHEVQPNLRVVWRATDETSLWAAVSRAIRSPTRTETGIRFDAAAVPPGQLGINSPAAVIRWSGQPGHRAEELFAYEAGLRLRPAPTLSLEFTAFVHDYNDVTDIAPQGIPVIAASSNVQYTLSTWTYRNSLRAQTRGADAVLTYQPSPRQRWQAGVVHTRVSLSGPPGGTDEAYFEGSTPEYEAFLRGRFNVTPALEASFGFRAVGSRPSLGVPAYETVDVRLGWQVRPEFSLEVLGESLVDSTHPEFREGLGNQIYQVRRGVYVRATWRR